MLLKILNLLVLLLIAVPFLYIFIDVIFDMSKRIFEFFREKAKPVLIHIYSNIFQP
ncbi:MAG: hypothetical protein ACE5GL_01920 [Calditrichia bacterium]